MPTSQSLIVGYIENATPLTYNIYITDQGLPTIASPWTKVEIGAGVYTFRRSTDTSKTFDITGYISEDTMELTRLAAEDLNEALFVNPSGRLIDGFGVVRDVYVNSWQIKPIPAQNKYSVTMSYTLLEV